MISTAFAGGFHCGRKESESKTKAVGAEEKLQFRPEKMIDDKDVPPAAASIWKDIGKLESFESRFIETNGHQQAEVWLQQRLKQVASTCQHATVVHQQEFKFWWNNKERTGKNIMIGLAGKDRSRAVVVGAHYDTTGKYNPANSLAAMAPAPGADDDGSGVAGVVHLAEKFCQKKSTPKISTVFSLFDAEEEGLQGGKVLLQYLRHHGVEVEAMVDLDMIGWHAPGAKSVVRVGWSGGELSRQLAENAKALAPGSLTVQVEQAEKFHSESDYRVFGYGGIPAIIFIEAALNERRYHNARDTRSGMDPTYALAITELAGAVVEKIVRQPPPPSPDPRRFWASAP